MLLYLGTQTNTILYFDSRLPESNRGHVNILINDWIVYDDRPYCVRSRRVEPATESAVRVVGPTDSYLASPPRWCREHDRSVPLFNVNQLIHIAIE